MEKDACAWTKGCMASEKLAPQQLSNFSKAAHGHKLPQYAPGLWTHNLNQIKCTLVVDEFDVKHLSNEKADHIVQALNNKYEELGANQKGDKFCHINLEWDYEKIS